MNHTPFPFFAPIATTVFLPHVTFLIRLALALRQEATRPNPNSPFPPARPASSASPGSLRRRPSSPLALRDGHGPVDVGLLGVVAAAAAAAVAVAGAHAHALGRLFFVLAGEVLEVFDLVLCREGGLLVLGLSGGEW